MKVLLVLPQTFIMQKPRNVTIEERKPRTDNPIRINCKGKWMTGAQTIVIRLAEYLRRRGEIALAMILSNCTPESVLKLTQNKENLSG
jgi:hypothetical protein